MSTSTGADDLFVPLLVRAFGTVLMFLPLQLAALGPIPKQEIAASTGVFNLMRQLGGSLGVALLTFLLDERNAFHRARLVEHLGAIDVGANARVNGLARTFMAHGDSSWLAHQKALAALASTVARQASVLSFSDTFMATAAVVLGSLVLVTLLGKPPATAAPVDAH